MDPSIEASRSRSLATASHAAKLSLVEGFVGMSPETYTRFDSPVQILGIIKTHIGADRALKVNFLVKSQSINEPSEFVCRVHERSTKSQCLSGGEARAQLHRDQHLRNKQLTPSLQYAVSMSPAAQLGQLIEALQSRQQRYLQGAICTDKNFDYPRGLDWCASLPTYLCHGTF